MKKFRKIMALILVFALVIVFAAMSASAAQVEDYGCHACATDNDGIVEPARAYPCHSCDTGMMYKVLVNGVFKYKCNKCGYTTTTP